MPKKKSGGVGEIAKHAKKIRKEGEKWQSAIKRATAELKKEGKIG